MRTRVSMFCVATVACIAAAVLVPVSAQGEDLTAASPHVAATPKAAAKLKAANIRGIPVKSKYETKTRVISRDGGASVALPDGHDLWIFGDTGIYQRKGTGPWKPTDFIDGSSALLTKTTKGQVPSGGEIPSGAPKRFIPTPKGVYLPNGSGKPCIQTTAGFPARWPTGATMLSKQEVLITYSIVCITTPNGHANTRAEGWGYMLYNWKTHKIDHGPKDVFKPKKNGAKIVPSKIYGSPQVAAGSVTMFASTCTTQKSVGCANGVVWAVTVPATPAALDKPGNYKPVPLATDGASNWQPLSISVGRYGGGLKIVAMASITGAFRIYAAPNVAGPWVLKKAGNLPGCPSHTGFCFALEGHPELSTATHTFVSYKNPDSGPGGHVVVSAIPN
jgi:hypothetical protein